MSSPAAYQSLVVAIHHRLCAHDALGTRTEGGLSQRTGKGGGYLQVAVSGIEQVVLRHLYLLALVLPPLDFHLQDGSDRSASHYPFGP